MIRRCLVVATAVVASCGVRAPSRIDIAALVKQRGEVEARHDLEVRIVKSPTDLGARLALAALDEQAGRPSAAIEQLEVVIALGGPIGTRWHGDDRARLARLLAARGRARLERAAPTAIADLTRARELGATVADVDLLRARAAAAIVQLRHVDRELRATAKHTLLELATTAIADPSWRGADKATAAERGAFGVWAWRQGAKRAGWEELHAWHDAMPIPRDAEIGSVYLEARTWWAPSDAPPPEMTDLLGPLWCRYAKPTATGPCGSLELARGEPRDDAKIAALLSAPPARGATAGDAMGWLALTLRQALRGEAAWGPAFTARVDVAAIAPASLDASYRATFTQLVGRSAGTNAGGSSSAVNLGADRPIDRLVAAAGLALRSAPVAEVRAALGPVADTDDGRALLRIVAPPAPDPIASPHAAALVAHVRALVPYGPDAIALGRIVDAYRRDPAVADRIAGDVVAEAVDGATAYAALGALFVAIGDPARARTAWQAAVDSSAEPAFQRGLADAIARAHDPDAAMITGITAAAASGDPAVVWIAIARALFGTGELQHALEAAHSAIDLAGSDALADALDIAIDASRALGRTEQADALLVKRGRSSPPLTFQRDGDPTDAAAALADYRRNPTVGGVARLWVASRWNPRDVQLRTALLAAMPDDDPRRASIVAELVALASDRDPELGRAAIRALR